MKKIIAVFLIIFCAFIVFGRPALSAAVEDDRIAFLFLEPGSFALPGELFVISFVPVVFAREVFDQGQQTRCLEGYFLITRERSPPVVS